MEKSWIFPKKSFIKVNSHAIHYSHPLPNGNISGLGIVLRDCKGAIILMVSGSVPSVTERANELWGLLIGLTCAFYEGENRVEIETDNEEAVKEWVDWKWFVDPNHDGIIQQLLQRSSDPNLCLEKVKTISPSQNRLARYLAEEGARTRSRLVMFRRPFGLVRELWRLDMGLGPMIESFMVIDEEEYEAAQNEDEGDQSVQNPMAMPVQEEEEGDIGPVNVEGVVGLQAVEVEGEVKELHAWKLSWDFLRARKCLLIY